MIFLNCILFGLCFNCMNGELYTSIGHLVTLVESVDGVTRTMEKYMVNEYAVFDRARKLILDFRKISEEANANAEDFISNPVNSFLLIKKLNSDLQEFINLVNNRDRLNEFVDHLKRTYLLPTSEDYVGAAVALHRLEDVYQLDPADISAGRLSQKYKSRSLTAFEAFELGRIAYEKQDYYHTIRWMNQALIEIDVEEQNGRQVPSADKLSVLDYLAYASNQQGNIKHAFELTKKILELNPNHSRATTNLVYYQNALKDELQKRLGDTGIVFDYDSTQNDPLTFKNPRPKAHYEERDLYEALCRGKMLTIPPGRMRKLKCKYVDHNPLLIIGPVKEEQLYDKPAIYMYHDIITDQQVELMKHLGTPKLKRAIVRSPITGEYEAADYRISKSGWLRDAEHPHLAYLSKLVNAVTNLSLTSAEEWQIANYGIGGQYEPHFDFARKTDPGSPFDPSIGNRIATWLFYLEAPEKGGATVFPSINLAVQPKRRAAVFWYNLLPSGDGDYKTRHAACPVLFGTKWVSNRWFHSVGQELIRPCSLKREYSEEMHL